MVWDAANDRPTHRITAHQAAVKALAWCPFQANLLATGGGTADRTIKFHNTHTGGCGEWVGRQSGSGPGLSCVEVVAHRGRGAGGGSFCLAAAFWPSHTWSLSHSAALTQTPLLLLIPLLQGPSSTPLTPAARSARCSGTATSGRSCPPTASGGWVCVLC